MDRGAQDTLWALAQCSLTLDKQSLSLMLDTARNLVQASHLENKVLTMDPNTIFFVIIPEYPFVKLFDVEDLVILRPDHLQGERVVTMFDPVLHWRHRAWSGGKFQHFVTLKTFQRRCSDIHILFHHRIATGLHNKLDLVVFNQEREGVG